mmetsp:Transcript_17401/g.41244  ORF Transcript_17401/g.41244 Transcript_17401/m.41244 type:complete len:370 (+) Transcript_17401:56-1165(+)|eukprot:CAMPEP_0181413588 /NCGR_PEP_ID=MMETSP1110-20121109/9052_1 /TAXON_ID=174948 /ORGANISM="Symbiodinium sp., Strain CCMP421" /LENGTH=369 /DNA_ID=CAMNT_0023536411 /DNA_START=28 /DNA_END=1137 /DNA_ORIENTATION=-
MPTNRNREDALRAAADFASKAGSQQAAPLLPTTELRQRLEKGEDVVLVDVRCKEEMEVSMIPGSVTKEHFESQLLPGLRAADPQPLVVPYCTVGYRSGVYAKELMDKHGLQNVRNGEGVIMWTFDGSGLVRPASGVAGTVVGKAAEDAGEALTSAWQPVTRVHVYGKPWDMAAEGYTTEFFSQTGGAWRFLKQKCSKSGIKAVPWLFIFVMFYLFFTPACGVMYNCGCRVFPAKYGQVSTCNIFTPGQPPEHKCPWCSCQGISCLFVAFDTRAFRNVPLLDLIPDGCVVTMITVGILYFAFKRTDKLMRPRSFGPGAIAAAKSCVALTYFVLYCLAFGAIFFLGSSEYPYFLGIERELSLSVENATTAP